jgi:hypothetical protein
LPGRAGGAGNELAWAGGRRCIWMAEMKKLRTALVLGSLAACVTLYFVIAVHLGHGDGAIRYLRYINYLGIRFGIAFFDLFFVSRCFSVSPTEEILLDIFLVLTSGLQWFLVGWLIDFIIRRRAT